MVRRKRQVSDFGEQMSVFEEDALRVYLCARKTGVIWRAHLSRVAVGLGYGEVRFAEVAEGQSQGLLSDFQRFSQDIQSRGVHKLRLDLSYSLHGWKPENSTLNSHL